MGRNEVGAVACICALALILTAMPPLAKGSSLLVLGVNYLSSGNMYDDTSNSILTRDFTLFRNNNITDVTIRLVWSAIEGGTRGSYNTDMMNNVKRALNVAGNLGLRVHISFWTHFQEYATWSLPNYVRDPYTGRQITLAIVRSSTMRQAWLDMVSWTVRQVQSYPAIASWQVLNEPMYDSSFNAIDQKTNFQILWRDAVQLIRSLDSGKRPCSVRFAVADSPWSGEFDLSSIDYLDYVGINVYVDTNDFNRLQWGTWSMVYRAIGDVHARGKEIWFTEFGAWSDNLITQRNAYEATLDAAMARGVDGAFAWAWQSANPSEERYNVCLGTNGNAASAFYELASRGSTPGVPNAIPGDTNGDGHVDIRDMVTLSVSYSSIKGEARYNTNADINGDDSVDMADLIILARNYHKY